jgi:hypothetical protein
MTGAVSIVGGWRQAVDGMGEVIAINPCSDMLLVHGSNVSQCEKLYWNEQECTTERQLTDAFTNNGVGQFARLKTCCVKHYVPPGVL